MEIASYPDLLRAARNQPQAQRLLFVFAAAELPEQHTAGQLRRFESREGGTLAPVMCVDKLPDELDDFAALVAESDKTGQRWDIVFVASLSGNGGTAPASDAAEQSLKKMVNAIHQGMVSKFLAFNRSGEIVSFTE